MPWAIKEETMILALDHNPVNRIDYLQELGVENLTCRLMDEVLSNLVLTID